ncbi:hypothetical protein BC835DRAFT_772693 [Cytidiella melzeri]|nr:hypothetical protein BC835DRAFT_772693 [Cytidiella melzeri]
MEPTSTLTQPPNGFPMQQPRNDEANEGFMKAKPKKLLVASGHIYTLRIKNAQYTRRVLTDVSPPPGTGNYPIFAADDAGDKSQVWEWNSSKQTIRNLSTNNYAYPEGNLVGSRIMETPHFYKGWEIEEQGDGSYSICVEDEDIYWALTDGTCFNCVTLQKPSTGSSWKWTLNSA